MLNESAVAALFLAMFAAHFGLERLLSILNIRHVLAHRDGVPAALQGKVSIETQARSVEYTLARAKFGHVAAVYDALVLLAVLFGGVLPWLDARIAGVVTGELTRGVVLLFAASVAGGLLHLPLELYSTFVLEERFGFNKTDAKTFLLDKIKALIVGVVIGVPFMYGLLSFMHYSGPLWWVWAALFVIGFQFLMMVLYPLFIAPLFNKFTPLGDGELKAKLEDLAQRTNFATRGIFVMDGSKRSSHSNAYFTGFGRARRIVLFDTLIQQMSVAELAAVLAHEIGHFKLKHIPKMLILSTLMTLAGFFALNLLLNFAPMYRAFGIAEPNVALGLLLFSLIAGEFTFWAGPLFNRLSRKHEYEADAFAAQQTSAEPMETALIKLHEKNLSTTVPHPAYSAYHYSHPTLIERIGALRRSS